MTLSFKADRITSSLKEAGSFLGDLLGCLPTQEGPGTPKERTKLTARRTSATSLGISGSNSFQITLKDCALGSSLGHTPSPLLSECQDLHLPHSVNTPPCSPAEDLVALLPKRDWATLNRAAGWLSAVALRVEK